MFNALKYIEELEKSGLTREQAEAWIKCQVEIMDQTLATKQSVKDSENILRQEGLSLRQEMKDGFTLTKHRMDQIEQKFEFKIEQLESRMTIKLGSMLAATVALVVTLIKTL